MDFALPDDQMDQDGDEADGEESEGDDHAVGSVLKLQLVLGTVLKVVGVDAEEEVLSAGVWVKAVEDL